MNKSISAVWVIILLGMFCYCTNSEPALPPSGLSGDQLATKYCGSCHEYTPPHLLTKTIWRDDVLPAMGHHLGIYPDGIRPDSLLTQSGNPEVVINAGIFPDNPLLASEDWEKIVDYYTTQAPEHLIQPTENNSIIPKLAHFTYRESDYSRRPSLTTMVKILPEQNGLVFADSKPGINKLIFLDQDLTMRSELNFKTAPIQFDERLDTLLITTIGTNPFPSDRTDGDFQMVYKTGNSQIYNGSSIILPDLKRPVHVAYGDLDQDGQEDDHRGHHVARTAAHELVDVAGNDAAQHADDEPTHQHAPDGIDAAEDDDGHRREEQHRQGPVHALHRSPEYTGGNGGDPGQAPGNADRPLHGDADRPTGDMIVGHRPQLGSQPGAEEEQCGNDHQDRDQATHEVGPVDEDVADDDGRQADTEIQRALDQQFLPLTLGPRVLRTETAPIAALSAVQLLWGDLG